LKTKELGTDLAEILNNYNHPLFDKAFQMIDDKEFYDGKFTNKHTTAIDGDNSRGVPTTYSIVYEGYQKT